MTETPPASGSSPMWSTLGQILRIVLLGTVFGVVLFAGYLALAVFGI